MRLRLPVSGPSLRGLRGICEIGSGVVNWVGAIKMRGEFWGGGAWLLPASRCETEAVDSRDSTPRALTKIV